MDAYQIAKGINRLSDINSRRWINFLLKLLPSLEDINIAELNALELRMLKMFYVTIWGDRSWAPDEMLANLHNLANNRDKVGELLARLRFRYEQIDFTEKAINLGFDCPLDVYCSYSRDQLFVALDFLKPNSVMQGVKVLPEKQAVVLLVTLDKADFPREIKYKDYFIDEHTFHWQSQLSTTPYSHLGQLYIQHKARGVKVLLFVRESKNDKGRTLPYTFLGTVNFVDYKGSAPMNITWQLNEPCPAKFLKKIN